MIFSCGLKVMWVSESVWASYYVCMYAYEVNLVQCGNANNKKKIKGRR